MPSLLVAFAVEAFANVASVSDLRDAAVAGSPGFAGAAAGQV